MRTMRMASACFLTSLLFAGCSDRNTPTAPATADAVAPAPAGFIGDRPYTWSLTCSGDFGSSASWSWTAAGVPIAGTAVSTGCGSGSGVRPAAADGFSACVNGDGTFNGSCQTWTFDPAGPFSAQLKGVAYQYDFVKCPPLSKRNGGIGKCTLKATGTLNVDS